MAHSEGSTRINPMIVFGVVAMLLVVYLFVDSRMYSAPELVGSANGFDQNELLRQLNARLDDVTRKVEAVGKEIKAEVINSSQHWQDLRRAVSSSQSASSSSSSSSCSSEEASKLEFRKWFSRVIGIETPGPLLRHPACASSLPHRTGPGSAIGVEDRSYIIPMARFINCSASVFRKRFYFDLGTSHFDSSVGWFLKNYPCKFDAIYGWEVRPNVFIVPEDLPQKVKDSIHFDNKYVGVTDGPDRIDFPAFLKRIVKKEDFVVVKMDIEGAEWDVMPGLEKTGAHELIDEMFVEIHFKHPLMSQYGWDAFPGHTLEDARALLDHWRYDLGVPIHYWP